MIALPFGMLGIDGDRALVAVEHGEVERVGALDVAQLAAGDVADARPLDLDAVGAHVAEQLRAGRPRLHVGEVEHLDAVERLAGRPQAAVDGFGRPFALRAVAGSWPNAAWRPWPMLAHRRRHCPRRAFFSTLFFGFGPGLRLGTHGAWPRLGLPDFRLAPCHSVPSSLRAVGWAKAPKSRLPTKTISILPAGATALRACSPTFFRSALCGLRLPMRPLSLPAAGSITALISVGLPESIASFTARLSSSGVVALTPTPPNASIILS